jgi:hypothetical protein
MFEEDVARMESRPLVRRVVNAENERIAILCRRPR